MKSDLLCYSRLKSSSPGGLLVGACGSLLTKREADLGVSERTIISQILCCGDPLTGVSFISQVICVTPRGAKYKGATIA